MGSALVASGFSDAAAGVLSFVALGAALVGFHAAASGVLRSR
jgi:hypothetical protein